MCAKPIMALRRTTMLVFNPRAAVVSIDRAKEGSEPRRVCRRLIYLSYAAISGLSRVA